MKKGIRTLGSLALVFIMLCQLGGCSFFSRTQQASFSGSVSIEAAAATKDGIDLLAGFVIASTEPINEDLVRQALQLSPAFDYSLKKEKGGQVYKVIPTKALAENTLYKVGFDPQNTLSGQEPRSDHQWAFQTTGQFAVKSVLPRDASIGVPVTAGIEISFSQVPDLESIKKQVSFEPALKGQWSLRDKTAVFVPAQPLEYSLIYKVQISAQVQNEAKNAALAKETRALFETEAKEARQETMYFEVSGQNKVFRPVETPYFLYFNNKNSATRAEVTIYQYKDHLAYLAALKEQTAGYEWSYAVRSKLLPVADLGIKSQFVLEGQRSNDFWYFFFPEAIDTGYYLAEFIADGIKRQSLFQVTDLSAYLASDEAEALVWVNDLRNGQPLADARIQVADTRIQGTTDSNGCSILKLEPRESGENIFMISHGADILIMNAGKDRYNYEANSTSWYEQQNQRQGYWNYLYTDRPLYRPGDTVQLFGVLAPREEAYPAVSEVTLQLNSAGSQYNSPTVLKLPVEDGIIKGSWLLPILSPGYYYFSMYVDDVYFSSAYFQVALYEKPAFQLTMSTEQNAVMAGEKVAWTTQAAFFEGTPLPELAVNFSGDLIKKEIQVLTDINGQIRFNTDTKVADTNSLYSWQWLHAYAAMPETGYIERWQSVIVFNSDVELSGRASRDGNTMTFKVTGHSIDLDKIADWSKDISEQALSPLGAPVGLKATLIRQEWDRVLRNYTYDPYTKQNVPNYDYQLRQEVESSFDWSLAGAGEQTFTAPLNQDNAYYLEVRGKDKAGRDFVRTYYLPATRQNYSNNMNPYYWLSTDDQKNTADFGELVTLRIYSEEMPLSPQGGNFLFYRTRESIMDYTLLQENQYSFTFKEEYLPNLNVMGVYFDGKAYHCVNYPYNVWMNLNQRQAKVRIETDKEAYRPGDTVKLALELTDGQDRPMAGYVNLNLIDEALLAITDQYVDMAASIFWGNTYSFKLRYTTSHVPFYLNSMAEGGGEGDGSRSEFRDTALFETIKTDAQGHGSVEFKLPDNITSWRVVWQAYVPDIWTGSGSGSIKVSLPFFTDVRLSEVFLSQDEPVLGLRSAGSAISPAQSNSVEWTVQIPEVKFEKTLTGQAFNWTDCQLPALPPGEYTLKVSSRFLNYEDAIQRQFTVVDSLQSHKQLSADTLSASFRPGGTQQGITTLSFSNRQRNLTLQGLSQLAGQDNVRMEQRLASFAARQILTEKFDWSIWQSSETEIRLLKEQLLRYQQYSGGISILPYSEADLEASALAASCGSDYFDQSALAAYFNTILGSEEADLEERSIALWGSAALGQPVLKDINELLGNLSGGGAAGELPGEVQLNLLLAKTFAGDGANTKALAQSFVTKWSEELGGARRANIGQGGDERLKATARMAMLSQLLDLPEAEGLYQYTVENQSEADYFLLEQLIFLKAGLRTLPQTASFSYTLDGKTQKVDLIKTPVYTLSLTHEERAAIQFKDIQGEIMVLSSYEVSGLPQDGEPSPDLKIERSFKVGGKATVSLPTQGKIQVSIDYEIPADAPAGWYRIVDCLPAGLRYVSMAKADLGNVDGPWLLMENGNQLIFGLAKSQKGVKGTLNYYVRVAMPGTFRGEATYMTHSRYSNVYTFGSETKLRIH